MTDGETPVVDLIIWLETPEKQVMADEIITKVESLGISVNAIYLEFDEWRYRATFTDDYDLSFGGILNLPDVDDIFTHAYIFGILNYIVLRCDDPKLIKQTDKIYGMFWEAMMNPDVVDEDFMNDMIDVFHDIQERLWENQYMFTFVQWIDPVAGLRNGESMNVNCLPGRVFEDISLRLELNSIIDRSVFLDYHAAYNPYPTYEFYHFFHWTSYHDTSLPNTYPT
ncbi:MAG: hypothetical protein FK732_02040 [Asgard group archaeon]|nr:hypothetical protein [Asgard group archaeon]